MPRSPMVSMRWCCGTDSSRTLRYPIRTGGLVETVEDLGVIRLLAETDAGPSARRQDGPARAGHSPRRFARSAWDERPSATKHLLLNIHSALQRPLHRALSRCRRYRFFASAGCGVVDHEIGLSGYVGLEIAQKTRRLTRGRDGWRRIVSRGVKRAQGFANEIERAPDLTMPQTLTDPPDGLGEASPGPTIPLRGVRPTLGRWGAC
jgi:hypothetical protein